MGEQNERKIEVLKSEITKLKNEFNNMRTYQERQCLCKYYEETIGKMKDENTKYIDKLKSTYQRDIEEYKGRYEDIKLKLALDINEKTLEYIKERHF